MMAGRSKAEDLVACWARWNHSPASGYQTRQLADALEAYAGEHAGPLREHIAGELRRWGTAIFPRDIREAIYSYPGAGPDGIEPLEAPTLPCAVLAPVEADDGSPYLCDLTTAHAGNHQCWAEDGARLEWKADRPC